MTDDMTMSDLRDYYDSNDQTNALTRATHETGTGEVLVSTSIRLPKSLMDAVRIQAEHAGVPVTTLMRQRITTHLDGRFAQDPAVSGARCVRPLARHRLHRRGRRRRAPTTSALTATTQLAPDRASA
jgi:predicted DNA binding CopG/RHH family protein